MRKGVGENVNYTDARPIRIRFDLNFEGFRAKLQSTSISTFKNNGLVDLSCHEEGIGSQGFRGVSLIIRFVRLGFQFFISWKFSLLVGIKLYSPENDYLMKRYWAKIGMSWKIPGVSSGAETGVGRCSYVHPQPKALSNSPGEPPPPSSQLTVPLISGGGET